MLNINLSSLDSCTVMAVAIISVLPTYGINEDFLGLGRYYDVYVPPALNLASFLVLILAFWVLCQLTGRSLSRLSDR